MNIKIGIVRYEVYKTGKLLKITKKKPGLKKTRLNKIKKGLNMTFD